MTSTIPLFFGDLKWPAMGPDVALGSGTIPALQRFKRRNYVVKPQVVCKKSRLRRQTLEWIDTQIPYDRFKAIQRPSFTGEWPGKKAHRFTDSQ